MPKRSDSIRLDPKEEILALLSNSRDLAFHQKLTEARLVLVATKKIAHEFGLDCGELIDHLHSIVIAKPFPVVQEEFLRAAKKISLMK